MPQCIARRVYVPALVVAFSVSLAAGALSDDELRWERAAPSSPDAPWTPPDLADYARALQLPKSPALETGRAYDLPALIDVAERANPKTHIAWERARQAALAAGLVESEYYPMLALVASMGAQSRVIPAPTTLVSDGFFRLDYGDVTPILSLRWLIFDFGRRSAALDAATEQLLAADLGFNATHQEVVFRVQRSFYDLVSVRSRIGVAEKSLDAAREVEAAANARLEHGLATLPQASLARQQAIQAAWELEDAQARERDAQVALAQSIGTVPTTPIEVVDLSSIALPTALEPAVDGVIDRALRQRPDLIAKVAMLRAREAEVRQARAEFLPKLSLDSDVGWRFAQSRFTTSPGSGPLAGINTPRTGYSDPSYGAQLTLTWPLFEGFARIRRLELARSEVRAAEHDLVDARDEAIQEVWKAYTDASMALRKLAVAAALVKASQATYDATLGSYQVGRGTLVDLLAARRELSRAQYVEVETKTQVLTASAALAFGSGDLGLELQQKSTKP
ncbi:MAG TPA: TolC family protein [Myxococcota bacterium]|nr:TolC family protein [Myxococcota bacterium]